MESRNSNPEKSSYHFQTGSSRETSEERRRIVIHIGHPKTGSSAIQSCLARNREALLKNGISYPEYSDQSAFLGKTSTGNGMSLLERDDLNPDAKNTVVYSSELLYTKLLDKDARDRLFTKARSQDLALEIVIYTRDIFDFSFSGWGQYIKRGRGVKDYNSYTRDPNIARGHSVLDTYIELERWLKLSTEENFLLSIYNYDNYKEKINDHFIEKVLLQTISGGPYNTFNGERVNRSLTLTEYEIQRQFNIHSKQHTSGFVSDNLVNNLPDISSERPKIYRETYDFIVENFGAFIDSINSQLPRMEHTKLRSFEEVNKTSKETPEDFYQLSREQIEILVQGISLEMEKIRRKTGLRYTIKTAIRRLINRKFIR